MPPLPKRPVALQKTLAQQSWVERTFRMTFEETTTEERGPTLGPIGMYSEPLETDKSKTLWRLVHLPSEHPLASLLLKEHAEKLAEYLFKHYRMELELEDRRQIKEKLGKTWVKDWITECHVQMKWLDPEEFRKPYEIVKSSALKPTGPLQLGEEVT